MSSFFCLSWLDKQRGVPNRASPNYDLNKMLQSGERPSYAAMLKFDLYDEGDLPSPVTPPHYSHFSVSLRPRTRSKNGRNMNPNEDLREEHETTDTQNSALHDLPSHLSSTSTSFDLRAPSIPIQRNTHLQKTYFNFRAINRGQLHTPAYVPETTLFSPGAHSNQRWTLDDPEIPVVNMTPRLFYEEAQWYPKPPRWHYSHRFEILQGPGNVSRGERRRRQLRFGGMGTDGLGLEAWERDGFEVWLRSIREDARWAEEDTERYWWDSGAGWVDAEGMRERRRVELGALLGVQDENVVSRAEADVDADASDDWEIVYEV